MVLAPAHPSEDTMPDGQTTNETAPESPAPGAGDTDDPRRAEKDAYLDAMIARRGYVLPYHRALVENDLDVMKAMDGLVDAAYLRPRRLSGREKELLFIVSLTVLQADRRQLESHIDKALSLGVPAADILEAIEIALPEAGVVAFQHGVEAWQSAVDKHRQATR
ncbi:MAG TPA: carboxymuconolactone decarboxylase family protein [Mycobacteriales bacterium]|nr:carboxymuconolactone decarboxylase family protein [Mycobacteriales bacterium]